jgi:hypothetical protein
MPECAINDCNRKNYGRGWCESHYNRYRRTGDPVGSRVPDMPPDLPGERWLPIPGWEGYYSVSDMGRVRSEARAITHRDGKTQTRKGQLLRPTEHNGRYQVRLKRPGYRQTCRVHQLVMLAFVGPCPPGLEVCHTQGNALDNRLTGLRYDTSSNNRLDSVRHGTHPHARKTHCCYSHRLVAPNLTPASMRRGQRGCLACSRARNNTSYATRVGRSCDFRALADQYYAGIMAAA